MVPDPDPANLRPPDAGPFLFAGLDDLIAMKLAAGRPQDELDVASLQRPRRDRVTCSLGRR